MMTDEYIRRDDFIQYLEKCKKGAAVTNLVWAAIMAIERDVRDMPAADVAPVVRCKDCEFSRELTKTEKKIWRDECRACESPEASQDGYMIVFPEHFCSYGRRKEQCD